MIRTKKVDSAQIQHRNYVDTMAGTRYSLNIGEDQGSIAAVPLYKCTLRYQDRRERQTPEERRFWDEYLKS